MSWEETDRLIERFAAETGMDEAGTRLFGNLDDPDPRTPTTKLGCWMPATDATFDTGILAISSNRCACLWIEDED